MSLPHLLISCPHSANFTEKIEANRIEFSQTPPLPTYLHQCPNNLPSLLFQMNYPFFNQRLDPSVLFPLYASPRPVHCPVLCLEHPDNSVHHQRARYMLLPPLLLQDKGAILGSAVSLQSCREHNPMAPSFTPLLCMHTSRLLPRLSP